MIFLLFCSFMVGLVDDRSAKSVLGLDFCWIFLVYILKCFEFFLCVLTPLCRMQQSCSHSSVSAIVAGRNALVVSVFPLPVCDRCEGFSCNQCCGDGGGVGEKINTFNVTCGQWNTGVIYVGLATL